MRWEEDTSRGVCDAKTPYLRVCVCVCVRLWRLRTQGGELIPLVTNSQGHVGGRASSALISIDKASLRAVFRGERRRRVRDRGAASAAAMPPAAVAGGLLLAAMANNSSRHTPRAYALWRDVRRMRPGGEGACVTTLLEMPFGAQR